MELRQLVKEVPYLLETRGDMSVEIAALCSNSREKTENGIFFCFAGAHFDAHQYASQAVQNGCVALVVERAAGAGEQRPRGNGENQRGVL